MPEEANKIQSNQIKRNDIMTESVSTHKFKPIRVNDKSNLEYQPKNGNETTGISSHHQSSTKQTINPPQSPKSAQLEASPRDCSLEQTMSLSSNDSTASDIYDPEGPILPMSPVLFTTDSPPLSPPNTDVSKDRYRPEEDDKNDDDVPSSAVSLNQKEKYLQKLNRQERVVEEVKLALKPHYQKRSINKEQYKDVLRRAVPKVSPIHPP